MRKYIYLGLLLFFALCILPIGANAATKTWSAIVPEGFTQLTWAKAPGITTFYKAQTGNGYLDYITVIYLPNNQIKLITVAPPQTPWTETPSPFNLLPNVSNWVFSKMVTEQAKIQNPGAQFMWNMPFFNITGATTDLSLALKSLLGPSPYISSGSRPESDMARSRRMLIIDNENSTAQITDFDENVFLASGDQAVEGFTPFAIANDDGDGSARLFVGVRANGKELVIYCSRGASPQEANNSLLAAGVPTENQLQADGGASATCAYNMPGQYFVEPGRMLPHLMGAYSFLFRGKIINEGVNVRVGPGITNKSIAKLLKGTPVTAYEEKNGWVKIDEQAAKWVLKKLIKQN